MDVIPNLPSGLIAHRAAPLEPLPAKVLVTWPVGTFVENLLVRANGDIVVSVHSESRLDRIDSNGALHQWVALPFPPTSLVEHNDGLFVFGGNPGQPPAVCMHVSRDGGVEVFVELAGALFLNGSTPFRKGYVLAVDSLRGILFRIGIESRQAEVWFSDELLTKISTFPLMPGGNGIQIHGGFVYVSNTDRAILVRIPIEADGSAGAIEVVAEHVRADDFTFDTAGNVYLTTHVENTLERLAVDGTRVALAGPEQGMAGSTAARFGRGARSSSTLFVTTTGGLIGPYQGVAQEAKLVAIETAATGHPIEFLEAR